MIPHIQQINPLSTYFYQYFPSCCTFEHYCLLSEYAYYRYSPKKNHQHKIEYSSHYKTKFWQGNNLG